MPEKKQIVVIGGGVAAKGFISAALKHHQNIKIIAVSETAETIIPCGIPYVFGTLASPRDDVSPRNKLINAGVIFHQGRAVKINRETRYVTLENGDDLYYDKLILATGTKPVTLPLPGFELQGVYTIQKDLHKVAHLKEAIDAAENIVVIGGGFIGVEIADETAKLGKNVALVEAGDFCLWQAFDQEFAAQAENKLQERGAQLFTCCGVKELHGKNGRVTGVLLGTGQVLKADVVISAVGVRPRDELARESGLSVAAEGGVVVDRYLHTTDPDILAVGDVAAKVDFFDGSPSRIKLASVAATEGKLAALNLFNKQTPGSAGVISLFATAAGDLYFGAAGLTEQQAQQKNLHYVTANASVVNRHPGVMPKAKNVTVKAIFSVPEGQLLGAQITGGEAAADFTNLLGLAIQNRMTAYNLLALQYGTHPMLTAGPTLYPVFTLAEEAITQLTSAK